VINELKNLDVKGRTIKEVKIRDHLKNFLRNYEKRIVDNDNLKTIGKNNSS